MSISKGKSRPATVPAIDLTGQRFGALVAVARSGSVGALGAKFAHWECLCDCGQTIFVSSKYLRRGSKKACGINGHTARAQQIDLTWPTIAAAEYKCWNKLRKRCRNPKHQRYSNYGGRGIRVCKRWDCFENFLSDMGLKPSPHHTVERIDVNGNYEPSNCRWATPDEQYRNKTNSVYVTYKGERLLLIDLVSRLGLSRAVVYGRLKNGWPLEIAIAIPVKLYKKRTTHKPPRSALT